MPEVKEENKPPVKRYWVTYKLQSLSTEKFLEVVNKILRGEHILLEPAQEEKDNSGSAEEYDLIEG
jgi:hypothetical protein